MRDLSSTIGRLGNWQQYPVTRYKTQGTTDGNIDPIRPDGDPIIITAAIQPATGKDLQRLPEGFRTSEVIVIWTSTQLRALGTTAQGETNPPDTILYDGDTYQIEACDKWAMMGNYYEALARKVAR